MYEEKLSLLGEEHHSIRKKKSVKQHFVLLAMGTGLILLTSALIFVSVLYALRFKPKEKCSLYQSDVTAKNVFIHSAISSDASLCASVANNIMSVKGGNAVDGFIAGLLCTCSINLHSCGISGGSFVMIYNRTTNKMYAIDIRETAPELATQDMYIDDKISSRIGGKSIAVFGLVPGLFEIHQKFGKLKWSTLLQPSIDILNNGFYISSHLEGSIDYFFKETKESQFPELRKLLTDPSTGEQKRSGDILKNPKLAQTMKILAEEPYAMNNGSLVKTIVAEIQNEGGIITENDMKNYKSKWREPVKIKIGETNTLYTLPPPSSGLLVAFGLNVLSNYDFSPNYLDSCENTALFFHRLIETMKFSFAKRSALGDIDFVDNDQLIRNLSSDQYTKWIHSLISDSKTHPVSFYHPSFQVKSDSGTSHFSLVSPDGDAVSSTTTINFLMGSFVMGNVTGILYNDEMDDFSTPNEKNSYNLPPSPSNFIKPNKRPMSSMSPIIVVNNEGNVELVLGSAGGSKILSSVIMVASLSLLLDKDLKTAIDALRVHHQLVPNEVFVEYDFPETIIKSLEKRGHKVKKSNDLSIVQGVKWSEKLQMWECNADFRKMGLCDGS